VFERFTDRARRVLTLAQEEARLLNHGFIGTEHLLLGLIHEHEGGAAKALEALGISHEAVREKVVETIGKAETAPSGSPPFTPRAKKVLELSLREALQLHHSYISTEHLLLGLVREGEGVAATVLVSLGADLGRVRQEVIASMSGARGETYDEGTVTMTGPTSALDTEALASRGPLCPHCRGTLIDGVRYRTIAVDAHDEGGEPISTYVVFCLHCGVTIEMFRGED
jgi:ATP-dependent Clp protease ATP-binding subunit ClpC